MKNNRISNLAEFRRWVKIRLVEKEISQNELATVDDVKMVCGIEICRKCAAKIAEVFR